MKFRFVLIGFSVLSFAAARSEEAANWHQFQGPDRTGAITLAGLDLEGWITADPKPNWSVELHEGFGGAAIFDDEVFVLDRDPAEADLLLCLDLKSGSEKWRFRFEHAGILPHSGSRGVPLVEKDAVYFIGGLGDVHRINKTTGEAEWTVSIQDRYGALPPKWGWAQSPLIVGEVLIAAAMSEEAGLVGLDKSTGKELWRTRAFGDSHSSPTTLTLDGVEQVVFIATERDGDGGIGTTISVDPQSGSTLWDTSIYFNKIPIPFPTKITDEQVFLTGGYGNGSAMLAFTKGAPDWEVEEQFSLEIGTQMHQPFLIDDHLYLLANENANHKGEARKTGGLMCLNLDGETIWHTGDSPFMGRGNMIRVNDHLLIQDGETGFLRLVAPSPQGYRELGMIDVFGKQDEVEAMIAKQAKRKFVRLPDFKLWSPMAIGQDHLILRGQEQLICYRLR